MFCPLEYRDSILILRGIVILVVVVILGVTVTEQQLNQLTQRQEMGEFFNITYDRSDIYSIYILGANYHVRAVYPVGQLNNEERAITIKTMNHSIKVPTYVEIDCKQELTLLDLWAKLLVKQAFAFKQVVSLYVTTMQERIQVYRSQFR